jgi:putative ABC transport system substrate-binding protein
LETAGNSNSKKTALVTGASSGIGHATAEALARAGFTVSGTRDEIEGVIAAQARDPGGGVVALANAFNTINRELIIELAARYRFPAIYFSAYCAQSGGLIGYGSDYAEQSRQAAGYIDRVLKGIKPADLPVQAPTKFELVINLKAAKALGLQAPEKLFALADEVIE